MSLFGNAQPSQGVGSGLFGGPVNNATNQPDSETPRPQFRDIFGSIHQNNDSTRPGGLFGNHNATGTGGLFGNSNAAGTGGFGSQQSQPPQVKKEDTTSSTKVKERFAHDQIIDFGTKIRAVRVGTDDDHIDYTVHESLLNRSPLLSLELQNSEDQQPFLYVSDVKPSAFGIYVQWLYSGRLHTKMPKDSATVTEPTHRREWFKLVDGYIIGEHLADIDFRDTVIDAMLEWCKEASPTDLKVLLDNVSEVYKSCKDNSPLRQLVSDVAAWHFVDADIQEMRTGSQGMLPYEFVLEVLCKLSTRLQGPTSKPQGGQGQGLQGLLSNAVYVLQSPVETGRGTCKYHCHGDKACYRQFG